MTKIYYVRHGQTDYNVRQLRTGRKNIKLTEIGEQQAYETAEKLKDTRFDVAFVSPLDRAKDTFTYINKYHNLNPIIDERIIERSFGETEGFSATEKNVSKEQLYDYYLNSDFGYNIEKMQDCGKRVNYFLDEISSKYKDKTILVVAHAGIGRMFEMYFAGGPKAGQKLTPPGNAEIKIYKYNN